MRLHAEAPSNGMVKKSTFSEFRPPLMALFPSQRMFWNERSVSTFSRNTLTILLIFKMFSGFKSWSMVALRKSCWSFIRPTSPMPPLPLFF